MTTEDTSKGGGWRAVLGMVAAAATVMAVTAGVVYANYRSAVDAPILERGESRTVHIPDGASWSRARGILRRSGLVEYPVYFEIWARATALPRSVGAGTYHFEGPMTMPDLAEALRSGGAGREVEITFPEGWTIFEIADRVDEEGLVEREAFLEAARDPELLGQAGIDARTFEGYLFPETYRFRADAAPEEIVWRLHRTWHREWEKLLGEHPGALRRLEREFGVDRHEVVTLASIVQAEASVDEERAVVARVMLNRIDASMRLQADPTCVYGADRYRARPSPELCDDPSNRYSTYVIEGLPPGPIGNPGRSSLEATLDPAEGEEASEYLFYCARADGSGRHVFSTSYEAHRRAVEKHLK